MNTAVRQPLGLTVTDVDLADIGPDEVKNFRDLLAEHGVLVFAGQAIDDDEFHAFLTAFGDLAFTVGETPLTGYSDLNVISNLGRTTAPRSTFHVDTSYIHRPPAYTALRAVQIPAQGGETLFSDQYRAFDTLPDDVREHLEGRSITHVVTGVELGPRDEASAEHPIFRVHPRSGRTALYLTSPARCAAVSGLDAEEAAATVAYLFDHSTRPDNVFRHAWSAGDVVMWDNGCVMHKADHSGVVGGRVMHRGMVAGYGPDVTTDADRSVVV